MVELANVPFYSATTDVVKPNNGAVFKFNAFNATVHFVSDDWRLVHRSLQTSSFPSDDTGEDIANKLKGALESWHLRYFIWMLFNSILHFILFCK